jgi:hypothetical protein
VAEPAGAGLRCSQLSLARGEPDQGTAVTEAGVLLVEQPGPWGPAGLTESRLDAAVATELEARAGAAGLRVQAIRRPGRDTNERARRWAIAPPGYRGVAWGAFERDEQLLDLRLDAPGADLDPAPLFLVCAHGRRDRCCAIAGRPLAALLDDLAPGRVWETSHLGGHRFAATLLALPLGAVYGRVPLAEARRLVVASERGELLAELLRGRIGLSAAEQAADAFARRRLDVPRADAVRVLGSVPGLDGPTVVRLEVDGARYDVLVAERTVERNYVSCGKPAAKAQREVEPLAIQPLCAPD